MEAVEDDQHDDGPLDLAHSNEDNQPTSSSELLGWYSALCAAEVISVAAVNLFLPITLEELARARGMQVANPLRSCKEQTRSPAAKGQCFVVLAGFKVNTASFAMYVTSLSVLLQAIVVISMSGFADRGSHRKRLLLAVSITGVFTLFSFSIINSSVLVFAAVLAIVINVCLGCSLVLVNAYLPVLVRKHPTILETRIELESRAALPNDEQEQHLTMPDLDLDQTGLINGTSTNNKSTTLGESITTKSVLSNQISSHATAFGYSAGLMVLVLSNIIVQVTGQSMLSLKLALANAGVWSCLFLIPAAYYLRARPGPPLHKFIDRSCYRSCLSYIRYSWANLAKTLHQARKLKDVVLFLCAWFLISDATATVAGTAILFAKTTLAMEPAALIGVNMTTTICGILGAVTWPMVSRKLAINQVQTVTCCLCLFELIPLYGLLGFVPFIKNWGVFGLQQSWEMFPLAIIFGFVLGGIESHCRGLFGLLIPQGYEAAYFALYSVTDKGSSMFGPAIVGLITDSTGDIRRAFWFLAILVTLPILPLKYVNLGRGQHDAHMMSRF